MDKRLNTTLALFKTKQSNVAESAGSSGGKTYYKGLDLQSQGYEFDIAGRVYDSDVCHFDRLIDRKVNLVSGRDFPWPCGGHFDGFSDRLQSKLSDRSALRRP